MKRKKIFLRLFFPRNAAGLKKFFGAKISASSSWAKKGAFRVDANWRKRANANEASSSPSGRIASHSQSQAQPEAQLHFGDLLNDDKVEALLQPEFHLIVEQP